MAKIPPPDRPRERPILPVVVTSKPSDDLVVTNNTTAVDQDAIRSAIRDNKTEADAASALETVARAEERRQRTREIQAEIDELVARGSIDRAIEKATIARAEGYDVRIPERPERPAETGK